MLNTDRWFLYNTLLNSPLHRKWSQHCLYCQFWVPPPQKEPACLPSVAPACQEVDGRLSGGPSRESAVAGCDRVQGIGTRLAVQCGRVKLFKCFSRKPLDLSCALWYVWEGGFDFYSVHQWHQSFAKESLFLMATRLSYVFKECFKYFNFKDLIKSFF